MDGLDTLRSTNYVSGNNSMRPGSPAVGGMIGGFDMREQGQSARRERPVLEARRWIAATILTVLAGATQVSAQTVCQGQPWLGNNGPEMCIRIRDEGTGDTFFRRVASQTWPENRVVGSYRVALTFSYDIGPGGMGVTIDGDAWRETEGSGWLSIRVDGGTDISIPAGTGSLWLDGWATSVSGAKTGGGAGFRRSSGDVEFVGFPQVIDLGTMDADTFHGDISEIPIQHDQSVAVTNNTALWVPEVGDQIHVPVRTFSGHEPLEFGEPARRWENRTLVPGRIVYELAGTVLAGGDKPLTLAASITSDDTENHLFLNTFDPFAFPVDVTHEFAVANGFLFEIDACLIDVDRAVVPFLWWEDTGPNVWVAEYNDGEVTTNRVEGTVGKDIYGLSCFKTDDGLFLSALNDSAGTLEIYRRTQPGTYDYWAELDAIAIGGTPTAPFFGAAYGSAGSYETYGPGEGHEAILAVGLDNGTLAVVQYQTDTLEVSGIANLGPADGETSAHISAVELESERRAWLNWVNGSQAWTASWDLASGPGTAVKAQVGELEAGYLYPDYQYIGGLTSWDGSSHVIADKSWHVAPRGGLKSTVTELWSYPFSGMGGPVDLFPTEDSEVEGIALGPGGSLRFGLLKRAPEPADVSVPAVARVRGSGAFFTSVMHLANAGDESLGLDITYTPRQGSGGSAATVTHTVPAGVMQTIDDPLEELFGFSGSAGRVGSLQVEVTSGSAADLMLQTVVFARLDSGEEYGQLFPAMRAANIIPAGEKVYLNTTEDPVHNRVNIGLMGAVDGTRFRVTPMDPVGVGLAVPRTFDLDAGDSSQINNLHSTFDLGTAADVVVEVEVVSGSGFAYASVLDGNGDYTGTSDPTTILPVSEGSDKVTLLEIGSIQGLNEFSGSASITNYSNRSATVRADFYQRDISGVSATATMTIAAGDSVGYEDLGADLFGVSGDVGTVVLTATNGTVIGATGREFAVLRDGGQIVGTAGQLISGLTDEDRLGPGATYHFIGLRQQGGASGVERSHFAVFNPATTDGQVTVRLYDGATGALEGERSWTVPSRTLIQVNNVIREINPDHDGAEKRIEVEVNRMVFMNAFRVNPWGDPVTLSPFVH